MKPLPNIHICREDKLRTELTHILTMIGIDPTDKLDRIRDLIWIKLGNG